MQGLVGHCKDFHFYFGFYSVWGEKSLRCFEQRSDMT